MKKLITLVALVVVLIIVMAALWNKPYPGPVPGGVSEPVVTTNGGSTATSSSPGNIATTSPMSGSRVSKTGTFVCLPHKVPTGPQTMECAFGMKATDGNYYALDFAGMGVSAFDLPMGRTYTVVGLFTPVQSLNTNHWQNYAISGVIQVTSYAELEAGIPSEPVNSTFEMELNKPVMVENTQIKVNSVLEDSRCPTDVRCIQAGRVIALVTVHSATESQGVQLQPGMSITTSSYVITLKDVRPYPISTSKIADTDYRFQISVNKKIPD